MGTTFTLPMTLYKTRYATDYLSTFVWQRSQTKATTSKYTHRGEVPLFGYDGPFEWYAPAPDGSLSCDEKNSLGKAYMGGTLQGAINLFHIECNGPHGFFVGNKTAFSRYTLSALCLQPLNEQGCLMSADELHRRTDLIEAIDAYQQRFRSWDTDTTVCNVLCFVVGWAKHWDCIDLDFVNMSFQAGIQAPQFSLSGSGNQSFIPMQPYYSVGIPVQADLEIGLLHWLNIGTEILITPFIDSWKCLPQKGMKALFDPCFAECLPTSIQQRPFLYSHLYVEADEFFPRTLFLAGFSFAKQCQALFTQYPPHQKTMQFKQASWSRITFNLEFQVDLTQRDSCMTPRLKIVYIQPVYEQNTLKTRLLGGELALDFVCSF